MEQIDPFFNGGLTIASAAHFNERLNCLKDALQSDIPGRIVDEAKALLECVFRTIIIDRNGEVALHQGRQPGLPQLYSQAKSCIILSNDEIVAQRVDEACAKTSLIIGQVRNSNGAVSHGQDAYEYNLLGLHEAHFIAREALSISALFLNLQNSRNDSHLSSRLRYEDHTDFNNFLDESEEWPIVLGLEMKPSEVLFSSDPDRYKELLIEYHDNPQISTVREAA